MDANIVSLLIQVPVLGVFIWYSNKLVKDFMTALDKRDELYEKRNVALCGAINENTAQLRALTEMTVRHDERYDDPPTTPRKRGGSD